MVEPTGFVLERTIITFGAHFFLVAVATRLTLRTLVAVATRLTLRTLVAVATRRTPGRRLVLSELSLTLTVERSVLVFDPGEVALARSFPRNLEQVALARSETYLELTLQVLDLGQNVLDLSDSILDLVGVPRELVGVPRELVDVGRG